MNIWHVLTVLGWVFLIIDIFRNDWMARRLARLEQRSTPFIGSGNAL